MFETYQIKNFRCENSWFLPSKSRFTMESTVLGKWGKSLEGIRVITQIDTLIPTNQTQSVSKHNCHGTRPIGEQKRKIPKSRGTGLWRFLNFRDYSEWKSICTTKLNWFDQSRFITLMSTMISHRGLNPALISTIIQISGILSILLAFCEIRWIWGV